MTEASALSLGMQMPVDRWIELNRQAPYGDERDSYLAAYPPPELMQAVSGLTEQAHFAQHGAAIYQALHKASEGALASCLNILDFGCGCGRLARMFKGFPGRLTGCDIDGRLVDWINVGLPYMNAVQTYPNKPLPFDDKSFDCVISISVFTHLNEQSQDLYLAELARVTRPGGLLLLTVHGARAMQRAKTEKTIFDMLCVPQEGLDAAAAGMEAGRHNFIVQEQGHLTTDEYKYGITFTPAAYVQAHWGKHFQIERIVDGAIHDFQGIVVCRRP